MSEYFNQIIYGVKSFLTGMKLTLSHFNKKKELVATLQYPHEKWPIPDRNIGFEHSEYNLIRSRLHVDIDDCIACMQCEKACPVDCIKIDSIKPSKDNDYDCGMTSNDTQKKMIVSRFTIDMSECMYCNLCVFPCPEECIYMVGGPNDKKHEIDYEFSQYERDGMIFEFADATDEDIRSAGGEKWLDQRDARLEIVQEGENLKGVVQTDELKPAISSPVDSKEIRVDDSPTKVTQIASAELEIKSFNIIPDKMCRGIAKKTFTASKRANKDNPAILADVAQSLSDAGKMTSEIQSIIDNLSPSEITDDTDKDSDGKGVSTKNNSTIEDTPLNEVVEMDIKDLNAIEDKMIRGTAKKAYIAAKRSGEDKVKAVKKSIDEAGLMNDAIQNLLNSFIIDEEVVSDSADNANKEIVEENNQEKVDSDRSDESLFEIVDLNGIEDKMARGIAKKAYTAGKRAEKTRLQVIEDIRFVLSEAKKLDDSISKILNDLEKGN